MPQLDTYDVVNLEGVTLASVTLTVTLTNDYFFSSFVGF